MHDVDPLDDLSSLAATLPASHPRGESDGELEVPRVDVTGCDDLSLVATLVHHIDQRRPVILSNCVAHWPALRRWTHDYLRTTLRDNRIHVACTPNGLADAVTTAKDGAACFAKPHEVRMPFAAFLDAVESPRLQPDGRAARRAVLYASHQNGSLTGEFEPLLADVEPSMPWADQAFGRKPAAVNFWMGEDAARTTVHADLFDNVYVVIRGTKRFTLLPPQEGHLLRRRAYPAATYVPSSGAAEDAAAEDAAGAGLLLARDEPATDVLWSPITHLAAEAALRPVRATVGPGEVLYLPALWWHEVEQRGGEAGRECTVAVNYWYDSMS